MPEGRSHNDPAVSRCVSCDQMLPREAFWGNAWNEHGIDQPCRMCQESWSQETRIACSRCHRSKAEWQFKPGQSAAIQLSPVCSICEFQAAVLDDEPDTVLLFTRFEG